MRGKGMEKPNLEQFKILAEGYSVIRLNGKKPIEKHWEQYSHTKRPFEGIGFRTGENAGIACGPASSLIVLDIDNEELFRAAAQKQDWTVPDTHIIRTGSGGTHYYFRYPLDGKHYGNRSFKDYGFDIRGAGGQVVAPGSVHPDTGNLYLVEKDVPAAEPPEWLLELTVRKAGSTSSREKWDRSFEPVEVEPVNLDCLELTPHIKNLIEEGQPEGKRSEAIWAVLNALVSAGITDGQIISIFEQYPIGKKYQSKGESRQSWLLPQIRKARKKLSPDALPTNEYATLPDLDHETISPEAFVNRMEERWTLGLGNVSSEPLRQTWKQLATAFNFNISSHNNPDSSTKWAVVQPATGTGKTQSAVTYCSMLSELPDWFHPGALIVTRLIEDADLIVQQINQLSHREVAIAHHSQSNSRLLGLGAWPVLVITHKAYELALDYLGQEDIFHETWPFLHEYNGGHRKLVIIDECLELVEHSQVNLDRLRATLGVIPQFIREEFPNQIYTLEIMAKYTEGVAEILSGETSPEQTLSSVSLYEAVMAGTTSEDEQATAREYFDFTGLRKALRQKVRFDLTIGKNDLEENKRIGNIHDETLKHLQALAKGWLYYAKIDTKHVLNTARLLVPEDVKGAVILDATASSNVVYQLFVNAWLLEPPKGARNYANVTVHVSKGHKLGKRFMEHKDNSLKLCQEMMTDLNERLKGRNVLIVTHNRVEPFLHVPTADFNLHAAHWGKVDGSNQWKECDACVLFGIPYLPDWWTANTFQAYQGPRDTEWLRSDGDRPFKEHRDIRKALKVGRIVTDIVQGINRVQCRKVTDEHGNCPHTDVYLMLPNRQTADEIISGIQHQMPGVKVTEDWEYGSQKVKKRLRKSNFQPALTKFLDNMPAGRVSRSDVELRLGVPRSTMDRLITKARTPESDLSQLMANSGIRLEVKQEAKTRRIYFVKG